MPFNPLFGSLLSAGTSVLGNVFGFGSQQATNKAQMNLAEYQYSKALEMWNKQNEYNLPVNQMQRLRAAGLNPNLVYGNGHVAGLTSADAPQYKAPTLGAYTNFESLRVDQAVTTYQNVRLSNADIKKKEAETLNIASQTSINEFERQLKEIDLIKARLEVSDPKSWERSYWSDLLRERLHNLKTSSALNTSASILNADKSATEDYRQDLMAQQSETEKAKQGLIGSQIVGQNIENAYKPKLIQAKLADIRSQIERREALNDLTDAQRKVALRMVDKLQSDIDVNNGVVSLNGAKLTRQNLENYFLNILKTEQHNPMEGGWPGIINKLVYKYQDLWYDAVELFGGPKNPHNKPID